MGILFVLIVAGIAAFTVPHSIHQTQAKQQYEASLPPPAPAPTQLDGITIQDLSHD